MPNLVSEVNVSVVNNPTNISVSTVGVAGPSQDLTQLVADIESGQFYPASNPSNFISSGNVNNISGELSNRLTNSGQNLFNLINGLSGELQNSGTNLNNLIGTERNKNTITGMSISGGASATGLFSIVAGNNITLDLQGTNTLSIGAAGSSILSPITGSGTSLYLAKFAPNGSGLINSSIIDSGNQLQFGITNPNAPYSGVILITSGGLVGIGKTPGAGRVLDVLGAAGISTNLVVGTDLQIGSSNDITFASRSRFRSSADGRVLLGNNTVTDFDRLQFGGTTSSFPAIVKSGNNLQIRAADSSSFASISANSGIFTNWVGANLPLNTSPISALDVTGNISASGGFFLTNLKLSTPTVPATSDAAGTSGQISWDTGWFYVCVSGNSWKRTALSSW